MGDLFDTTAFYWLMIFFNRHHGNCTVARELDEYE